MLWTIFKLDAISFAVDRTIFYLYVFPSDRFRHGLNGRLRFFIFGHLLGEMPQLFLGYGFSRQRTGNRLESGSILLYLLIRRWMGRIIFSYGRRGTTAAPEKDRYKNAYTMQEPFGC